MHDPQLRRAPLGSAGAGLAPGKQKHRQGIQAQPTNDTAADVHAKRGMGVWTVDATAIKHTKALTAMQWRLTPSEQHALRVSFKHRDWQACMASTDTMLLIQKKHSSVAALQEEKCTRLHATPLYGSELLCNATHEYVNRPRATLYLACYLQADVLQATASSHGSWHA